MGEFGQVKKIKTRVSHGYHVELTAIDGDKVTVHIRPDGSYTVGRLDTVKLPLE